MRNPILISEGNRYGNKKGKLMLKSMNEDIWLIWEDNEFLISNVLPTHYIQCYLI